MTSLRSSIMNWLVGRAGLTLPTAGDTLGADTLAAATGDWDAANYVATTHHAYIPNARAATGVEAHQIIPCPRGAFAFLGVTRHQWGNGSGQVVTDGYEDGPHAFDVGKSQASRFVIQAGGITTAYIGKTQKTRASGTGTITIWMKSNTGSNQTMRISWNASTWQNCTVTPTWQRFQQTFSATTQFFPRLMGDGVNTADVSICDFKAWMGSPPPAVGEELPPAGHMVFLDHNNAAWPTVTGGEMVFQSANGLAGLMQFLPRAPWSDMTVLALCSRTISGTTASSEDSLFYTRSTVNNLQMRDMAATNPGLPETVMKGATTAGGMTDFCKTASKGYHVLAFAHGGLSTFDNRHPQRAYIDGYGYLDLGTIADSHTLTDDTFLTGAVSGSRLCGYRIARLAIWWGEALTPEQIRAASDQMIADAAARATGAITVTKTDKHVCWEGDSIPSFSTGIGGYPLQFQAANSASWIAGRAAGAGSTLMGGTSGALTFPARQAALLARFKARPGAKNVVVINAGANDGSTDPATWLAAMETYCAALKAAGLYVIVCTVLPRSEPGFNTWRDTINTALRAFPAAGKCHAIADFAANTTMGRDGDNTNLTYYSDGIHPTAAGHTILYGIVGPLVLAA